MVFIYFNPVILQRFENLFRRNTILHIQLEAFLYALKVKGGNGLPGVERYCSNEFDDFYEIVSQKKTGKFTKPHS